jgi:Lsr2
MHQLSSNKTTTISTAQIRAWAKDHGHEISELGRIPDTVLAAYERAH